MDYIVKRYFNFVLILLGLGGLLNCEREYLIKGPYLQNATMSQVTIAWETAKPMDSQVDYGLSSHLGQSVRSDEQVKLHEITLTNLEPEEHYCYQIKSCNIGRGMFSSEVTVSAAGTFQTAVYPNTSFRFAVYGDSRSNPEMHGTLAERMLEMEPDFIINTGDLVKDGKEYESWETEFFKPLKDVIAHIPIFPCLGNHENNSKYYFDFFSLPYNESWYSFDYGNAHFIALDSNAPYKPGSEQYQWLVEELKRNDSVWKFVYFHHPPYSSGKHKSDLAIRDAWTPLFMRYGVDIVFNGHEHIYERTKPIGYFSAPTKIYPMLTKGYVTSTKGYATAESMLANYGLTMPMLSSRAFQQESQPVTYVVTGGGGASLYDITPSQWTASAAKVNHFCLFKVFGETIEAVVYDNKGRAVDTFTIEKKDGRYSEEYLSEMIYYENIEFMRFVAENIEYVRLDAGRLEKMIADGIISEYVADELSDVAKRRTIFLLAPICNGVRPDSPMHTRGRRLMLATAVPWLFPPPPKESRKPFSTNWTRLQAKW